MSNVRLFEIQVSALVSNLKNAFKGGITVDNLVDAVTHAMSSVDAYKTLSGAEKKEVVLEALRRVMSSTGSNSGVDGLMDTLVPQLVDTIVVATKDGLAINKNAKKSYQRCVTCLSILFSCCNKK